MAGGKIAAIAGSADLEGGHRFLFHANLHRPVAILIDALQILRPRLAGAIHTVEALGVTVIVDLQLIVAADAELMGRFACGYALDGFLGGLQMFAGELEAVVPQRVFGRNAIPGFFPTI